MNKNISFLQVFGILLVVLGHSPNEEGIPFLSKWIYSYHMPLFIFISGYLFYLTTKDICNVKLFDLIKKKFIRLILPYIVISSIAYLPKVFLSKFAQRSIDLSIGSYVHSLLYPWDNVIRFFWFLPTLFFIMIIVVILLKITKNKLYIVFCFSIIFSFVVLNFIDIDVLNINGIFNYMLFFCLGMMYCKYKERLNEILRKNFSVIFILVFILLTMNATTSLFDGISVTGSETGKMKEVATNVEFVTYKLFYVVIAISGIILSIILSKLYCKYNYTFLAHLDGKTFTIYLLSWFSQVFVRIVGYQILNLSMIYVVPVSFILGVYVPVMINIYVKNFILKYNKFRFLSIILGINLKR